MTVASLTVEHADAIGPWGRGLDALTAWLSSTNGSGGSGGGATAAPRLVNVPGFIESPFINLTYTAQTDCLRRVRTRAGTAARVGIVLASVLGDTVTADKASVAVAAGGVPMPLLFYQSVPSAVLGRITAEVPATGPLVCLSGGPGLFADVIEVAELMFGGFGESGEPDESDEDVTHVLVTYVEAGGGRWRAAAARALARLWGEPIVPAWDCTVSVLISPHHGTPPGDGAGAGGGTAADNLRALPRPLRDFAELALAGPEARRPQSGPAVVALPARPQTAPYVDRTGEPNDQSR